MNAIKLHLQEELDMIDRLNAILGLSYFGSVIKFHFQDSRERICTDGLELV